MRFYRAALCAPSRRRTWFRQVAFPQVRETGRLGAGERIRTADLPLTRSIALSAVRTCENGSH